MESGLINLRAELLKKKAEAKKIADNERKFPIQQSKFIKKPKQVPSFTSSKAESKDKVNKEESAEEFRKLENSRNCLERKAALYDHLQRDPSILQGDEMNQHFLIDFQEKSKSGEDHHRSPSSHQFNHLKEAFAHGFSQDSSVIDLNSENLDDSYAHPSYSCESEEGRCANSRSLRSEQNKNLARTEHLALEEMHLKWNRMEEEAKKKKNLHYSDVLFDEARTHGASFVKFSHDGEERAAQQQLLRELATATNVATEERQKEKRNRRKQLELRLAKVRARKRLKLGLPIKDTDYESPPASDTEESNEVVQDSEQSCDGATKDDNSKINKESIRNRLDSMTAKEIPKVREWDLGKPGVARPPMSQQDWIEARRKIREAEFAPPVHQDMLDQSSITAGVKDYKLPPSNTHWRVKPCQERSTVLQSQYIPSHPPTTCTSTKSPFPNSASRHCKLTNISNRTGRSQLNAKDDDSGCSSSFSLDPEGESSPRRNLEFAPPGTYDYFRSSTTVRLKNQKSFAATTDCLEEAVDKGLAALRKGGTGL